MVSPLMETIDLACFVCLSVVSAVALFFSVMLQIKQICATELTPSKDAFIQTNMLFIIKQ